MIVRPLFAAPVVAAVAISTLLLAGGAKAQTAELSRLHDALHLSTGQEPGWRRYVASIRPDPEADARHRSAQSMLLSLPTPRRVDLINAEVDEDAAVVHRQGEAVKAFYAALTPDQQRTFDRQTAQMMEQQQRGDDDYESAPPLRQPAASQLPPPQP